jgi:hypothetical protein
MKSEAPIPDTCKSCSHRFNDSGEGQLCRKLDKQIPLSNGKILEWPGWEVREAFVKCKGELASPEIFGRLRYHLFM